MRWYSCNEIIWINFSQVIDGWGEVAQGHTRRTQSLLLSEESLSLHLGFHSQGMTQQLLSRDGRKRQRGANTYTWEVETEATQPFTENVRIKFYQLASAFLVQQGRNSFFVVETQWVQKSDWIEWKTSTESSGGNFSFPPCLHLKIIFCFSSCSSFLFSHFWVCCCCRRREQQRSE